MMTKTHLLLIFVGESVLLYMNNFFPFIFAYFISNHLFI